MIRFFVWQPVDSTGETCMVSLECRAESCICMEAGVEVVECFWQWCNLSGWSMERMQRHLIATRCREWWGERQLVVWIDSLDGVKPSFWPTVTPRQLSSPSCKPGLLNLAQNSLLHPIAPNPDWINASHQTMWFLGSHTHLNSCVSSSRQRNDEAFASIT